ncbi:hypothetical protein GOBAR_AA33314 [Gossypium barbadense]|uniref:Uncharacterized protein n=1 Tax=Gossypium barbadense TaxID=3634 RepID=A0A2P5W8E2_GOSBA|nr:hypothetical protein GOBAR_AA33314 [Gossypium barbadense]
MIRLKGDTQVVVEVGFHNHNVQRRGYHGGRTGHGSRGDSFPVEFQVPNRRMNWTMDGWWLRRWAVMTWRGIICNVLSVLLLGGLDEVVLEVPCQSSHIVTNGDDSSLMPLRLMANGEDNEIGKPQDEAELRYAQLAHLTAETELDHSEIIELCYNYLKMKGRVEFECELERNRRLISAVGPEDDAGPVLLFEASTIVFLPRGFDIVSAMKT